MSTNDINASEDTEMAECDGEKVVTMMDVLQEQEDFEEDANAVLGASDDKNCTYSKGYIKRQAIYACMTCCTDAKDDPSKRAGLCLACSLSCHENHELIELYTKRNFRCDCGNSKFNSHPCQFTPDKSEVNEENIYNQNFCGLYCICHRPYPDPEATTEQEMIQCIICEDWLHSSHLNAVVPPNEQYTEMICKACLDRNEFLKDYFDLTVNKVNEDVDIINNSSECDEKIKCEWNGISNTETDLDQSSTKSSCDRLSELKPDMKNNTVVEKENVTGYSIELKKCNTELQIAIEPVQKIISDDKSQSKKEVQDNTENLESNTVPGNGQNSTNDDNNKIKHDDKLKTNEQTSSLNEAPSDNIQNDESKLSVESSSEKSVFEKEQNISEQTDHTISSTEIISDNNASKTEQKNNEQTELPSTDTFSDKIVCEAEQKSNEPGEELASSEATCDETVSESEKENNGHNETINTSTEPMCEKEQTNSVEINPSVDIEQETITSLETIEKPDNRSQEQVEEDMLLADPMETVQSENKTLCEASPSNNSVNTNQMVDENKPETQNMDTSESVDTENNVEGNLNNASESVDITEQVKVPGKQMDENSPNDNSADVIINENHTDITENNDIQKDVGKENSNRNNDLTEKTAKEVDILKRKHVSEADSEDTEIKKVKVEKTLCVRPTSVKKLLQGATFWPSNFRHKLCTCNECISMYKDLSVLFLIDPEDTMTAYEKLGKEKTDGKPVSQYEKGMAALSSLGRVQQINALTEYTKMRDKLLEFLKGFKDRKVIVKEEDIKAFFADMKPVREPDGVYFCR